MEHVSIPIHVLGLLYLPGLSSQKARLSVERLANRFVRNTKSYFSDCQVWPRKEKNERFCDRLSPSILLLISHLPFEPFWDEAHKRGYSTTVNVISKF